MNNVIQRRIAVGAAYAPLSATPLVFSGDISCEPSNGAVVYFRGDDGSDVPWQKAEWHSVRGIDLATVFIKGTVGDHVTVIGGTWS
jgi:hypothetical protein